MAKLKHDDFELTKCELDLSPFKHECEDLLRSVSHTGVTFVKKTTTTVGDKTDNNTTTLQEYGRIHATFTMDPEATNLAMFAQKQIDGKNAGDKQTGSIAFFSSDGTETSRWNIERWHLEEYRIGPFSSKSSTPLVQSIVIDPEKFTRA